MYGSWQTSREQYVDEIVKYGEAGMLQWAAPQDWMCEPVMLSKTGLSVREHQERTIENFLWLRGKVGETVIPVLQGWQLPDYQKCAQMYESAGINLEKEITVGIGSVCRRQATSEISEIVGSLSYLNLHGFGVKIKGLALFGNQLYSADSMAWSFDARRKERLPGCMGHMNCANCYVFAEQWYQKVVNSL